MVQQQGVRTCNSEEKEQSHVADDTQWTALFHLDIAFAARVSSLSGVKVLPQQDQKTHT